MIKIEKTDVYGFESAIRGMRNPLNSWDKSDSYYGCRLNKETDNVNWNNHNDGEITRCETCTWFEPLCRDDELVGSRREYILGENDLKLMKSLSKAGNDHAKFLRMINVTVDITAPLYWWKEADTYAVGVVKNSCSTMHKIHDKEFTVDDFSIEHLEELVFQFFNQYIIECLNDYRKKYIETKDKKYWWQMIQLLPSSYNQKRTVQLNYQVLKSMYFARKNHKLDEWVEFCEWCEGLPYFQDICIQE